MTRLNILLVTSLLWTAVAAAEDVVTLPDTKPLTWDDSLPEQISERMVAGIDEFLMRKIEQSVQTRRKHWNPDVSSREAYENSVQPNRQRFSKIIGVVDQRLSVTMERFGDDDNPVAMAGYRIRTYPPSQVAETDRYGVYQVRWPVLGCVFGEGLLLEPKGKPIAHVVAIPDADQTPEQIVGLAPGVEGQSQFARRLAEQGCQVVVPVLINRADTYSGKPKVGSITNLPHREWLYRQAYEMGRHLIGYEVEKVLAAVDWFHGRHGHQAKVGVAGYGEGGLIAFYAAAVDTRIDAALVSGYFGPRERLWEEPIYRNVWALLHEFGDAEIASLIAPRVLVIEHSEAARVEGPPEPKKGQRQSAAPGRIWTPDYESVTAEYNRAQALPTPADRTHLRLVVDDQQRRPVRPGSDRALGEFITALGSSLAQPSQPQASAADRRRSFDPQLRQRRQIEQIENHVQQLMRDSHVVRDEFFLNQTDRSSAEAFAKDCVAFRQHFWEEVIGKVHDPLLAPNPRTRKTYDQPEWTGYDVVLDVFPDVFAWGVLLVPKDLKPHERRPVVVCQHGLEGLPRDTIEGDHRAYHDFAARLAQRGFIVYAPHNPYRGQDKFRVLQRKANPLKLSLFSFIVAQHGQTLNWLKTLPNVDSQRIGFYGLSYGGKTAMRVPAILEDYCLSICSGDFNEWIWKNVTLDWRGSYMFSREYEMPEFNLGGTFNYAEMAYLIFPRPFMVERGHDDGVGLDEWVAYEYAKVRRLYSKLGLPDRTEIEFFDGPHTIHGVGTFEFLHKHLKR